MTHERQGECKKRVPPERGTRFLCKREMRGMVRSVALGLGGIQLAALLPYAVQDEADHEGDDHGNDSADAGIEEVGHAVAADVSGQDQQSGRAGSVTADTGDAQVQAAHHGSDEAERLSSLAALGSSTGAADSKPHRAMIS